jgi:class 3 adenylate cyclase
MFPTSSTSGRGARQTVTVDVPKTHFAEAADGVHLGYQVAGDGPFTLVFEPFRNHLIELLWQEPGFVRTARRLGSFARTVWFDGRGIGASGGAIRDWLVDEIVDADLTAVLDAVGCEQVVLVGRDADFIRYAAEHPERVTALILINGYAHYVREHDYPWGMPRETLDRSMAIAKEVWGTSSAVAATCPSKADDEAFRAWWAQGERLGAGVDEGVALVRSRYEKDVRSLLPTLAVRTLVLHRADDRTIRVGAGRYLAEHILGAKYVELPGADNEFYVGDTDALVDEIEEFLTGVRSVPEGDLVTATMLFTDIVASTEQAARLGHRRWTTMHEQHDTMVRACLGRYRGHEIKTIGDGFLATFDSTTGAARAAVDIVTRARGMGIDVRAGVHTGEVEVRPDDVVGLAVSIAKRICDLAGPGQVLVSDTVDGQLVGTDLTTTEQGTHTLKGVPRTWRLHAVTTELGG